MAPFGSDSSECLFAEAVEAVLGMPLWVLSGAKATKVSQLVFLKAGFRHACMALFRSEVLLGPL